MKTISTLACIAVLVTGMAHAKGHDQGVGEAQGGPFVPTDPGAIEDTRNSAQGLGEALPTVVPSGGFSHTVRQNSEE